MSGLLVAQDVDPASILFDPAESCGGGTDRATICVTVPPVPIDAAVDVFLLFDDTGSFNDNTIATQNVFSQIVGDLQSALPDADFAFGIGRFEDYGGPGEDFGGRDSDGRPFTLNQAIVRATRAEFLNLIDTALDNYGPGGGGDLPESAIAEGLWQVASGLGFDGDNNGSKLDSGAAGELLTQIDPGDSGDVPPFSSYVGEADGALGGVGWRTDSIKIVILATDHCAIAPFDSNAAIPATIDGMNGPEPITAFACEGDLRFGFVSDETSEAANTIIDAVAPLGAATLPETIAMVNSLGIKVIGLAPGGSPTSSTAKDDDPDTFMSALARMTDAVDGSGDPLVFNISGGANPIRNAIVEGIIAAVAPPVDTLVEVLPPAGMEATFDPPLHQDVEPGEQVCFDAEFEGDTTWEGGTLNVVFRNGRDNGIIGTVPVEFRCDNPCDLPGRPDPDGSEDRVLRGYIVAFAVNAHNQEIRWNHLAGEATIVNYSEGSAWEYNGHSFAAMQDNADNGEQTGSPGVLNFDGNEFAPPYDQLVYNFVAANSVPYLNFAALRGLGIPVADGELILHHVDADFRQDGGPATTLAKIDVWNANEVKFSNTRRCVTCWNQTLLSDLNDPGVPNNFVLGVLGTSIGKARIDGIASDGVECVDAEDLPLMGVKSKVIGSQQVVRSGASLIGIGRQEAALFYDVLDAPPEGADRTQTRTSRDARQARGNDDSSRLRGLGDGVGTDRVSDSEKGSVVMFSKVELRWDDTGRLIQDTFIQLANDRGEDVKVQMLFINGDAPFTEFALDDVCEHPGWNFVDVEIPLTGHQTIYWSAARGLPAGVAPFTVLDKID